MQLTRLYIVLFPHLPLISAILENAQTVLTNDNVEIRIHSNSKEPYEKVLSEHAPSPLFKVPSATQENVTLIDFNSIELALPLVPITKYTPLNLASFSLLNAPYAYLSGKLSAGDLDCASSPPNALLGSRSNRSIWPRFSLSPFVFTSGAASNETNFQLRAITVKPLHLTPKYVTLRGQGYAIEGGRAVYYAGFSLTWLNGGYQRPFKLDLTRWERWRRELSVVEMWAESEDGEDWEFCVDGMEILVGGDEGG